MLYSGSNIHLSFTELFAPFFEPELVEFIISGGGMPFSERVNRLMPEQLPTFGLSSGTRERRIVGLVSSIATGFK